MKTPCGPWPTLRIARYGSVHLICNNAGVWSLGPLCETSVAEWRRVFDVNFWGVVYGVRTFVPLLLQNEEGGHVVNVASGAGLIATPFRAPYVASKHAVVGLTESLRAEMKARRSKLRVTLVCPGKLDTEIFQRFTGVEITDDPDTLETLRAVVAALDDEVATSPDDAARQVRDAIRAELPLVLPGVSPLVRRWLRRQTEAELAAVDRDMASPTPAP